MARARIFALLAGAGVLVALAPAASAAPTGTAVAKVYQLPCRAEVCGTGDKAIAAGSLVRGSIQIQVTSRSSIGLDAIRLEASRGDGWECWEAWNVGGANATTQTFDWDTSQWPGTCTRPGSSYSSNLQVSFRAVATENTSRDAQISPPVSLRVNNRPSTPEWASQPVAVGPEDGGPRVELSWYASPEPDIAEYHYVRIDPNGVEEEFAVSADAPGGQGCDSDGAMYTCVDDAFRSKGFGGRYTYLLVAYRSSSSTADSCSLPPRGGCVQSETSPERAATLDEPGIEEPPTKRTTSTVLSTRGGGGGRTRGPRPVGNGTSYASLAAGKYYREGPYENTLPYDDRTLLSPPEDDQPPVFAAGSQAQPAPTDGRRLWLFLAGGLMALVLAAHVARLARDPA